MYMISMVTQTGQFLPSDWAGCPHRRAQTDDLGFGARRLRGHTAPMQGTDSPVHQLLQPQPSQSGVSVNIERPSRFVPRLLPGRVLPPHEVDCSTNGATGTGVYGNLCKHLKIH